MSSVLSLHASALTDVGRVRQNNEDSFLLCDMTRRSRCRPGEELVQDLGRFGALFAVCDGMGGAAGGETASRLAVDFLYEQMIAAQAFQTLTRDMLAHQIVQTTEAANRHIFYEGQRNYALRGMGTTMTAAALIDDHLLLGQIGDSRAYVLRQGALVQVTRDQSLASGLVESGKMTEEEAQNFEYKNVILQALGTRDAVEVDLTCVRLYCSDVLLLCSDGLSNMLTSRQIADILLHDPNPRTASHALVEQANAAGGRDNVTVVVARFGGDALSLATKDTPLPSYRTYKTASETDTKKPFFFF